MRFIDHFKQLLTHLWLFVAFGFGSGLSPVVPGTMGTIAAIPFYCLLIYFLPSLYFYGFFVLFLFFLGIYICQKATNYLGVEDYKGIVWDEMVGYWATMLGIPFSLKALFLGFILFRLFDIIKPFPIGYVDRKVRGGLGIMLDDLLAAIPSCLILHYMLGRWI